MLPKSMLPNKRQKRAPEKATSHSLAMSEDSLDDSDTLFIPPKGNSQAQQKNVSKKVRLSACKVQDHTLKTSTFEPSTTGSASTGVAPAIMIPREEPAELADPATKPAATRNPAVKRKGPTRCKTLKRAGNILDTLGNFPGLLSTEEPSTSVSTSVTDEEQQDTESPDIVRAETPSTRPKPQQPLFTRKPRPSGINKQIEGTILVGVDL